MIRALLSSVAAAALLAGAGSAAAEPVAYDATLEGHALIPAATFLVPPADAPRALMMSGRFAGPDNALNERIGTVEGATWLAPADAPRTTGMFLPFAGQPVQGFSGIRHVGDGEFWALQDNGFGSKANSADAMLMAHRIRPDWETGRVEILDTVFFSDPGKVLPFPLVNGFTDERYLTGADFDVESIQPIGDRLWIGDEFGPYLFATDMEGRVVHFEKTALDGRTLRSPDNHGLRMPATPGEVSFEVRRSRGYEGMAAAPDGSMLYPLLEGPLWDAEAGAFETVDGTTVVTMLEYDPAARAWTGRHWRYPMEDAGHAIGDFNMISADRGLVIERDGGEGVPEMACEGEPRSDCFANPAVFKRVYLIRLPEAGVGEMVEKLAYVDLMDIEDPDGVARTGATADGEGGTFRFPFVTIEDVDMVDDNRIVVANDNNLPFSTGRAMGEADDTEFILLDVGGMLSHGE